MSSNRPYLLRAIYDWISDNNLTPYILVDAAYAGVRVPPQVVKDGQVVLNLATRAVAKLDLGNEWINFQARFSGVSQVIQVPVQAVLALYAQENGQGMMFPADGEGGDRPPPSAPAPDDSTPGVGENANKPTRGAPHLRVVK
ncbi:MAG: ClpXP protease specificity-enhancing factor [Rhodanobacter sp.]|nr:MAG: ClpXP protease specificity-enhancing factor [Rhodanobacter sp.]TAL95284.1 MAG: ClpXP protease specificity-enhancing factor [Rhodanobacter sp.]TAM43185.1 MAG: ClpXP protease specificity-enhancing factor [Rhodanobacter sp.]TAN26479.1 MAG: ClpXP protease specificity-enhancing factor [Rhodanobacter sp.]